MFTDVGGPFRPFARHRDEAVRASVRAHRESLARAATAHGGRVVQSTDDGLFLTFPSAAEAVRCAVEMQRAARGDGVALSVGIDAGEPVMEDGEPRGAPVLTASRLCDAADAGQILVSHVVHAVAAPHVAEPIRPTGMMRLRGLPDPVAVAQVVWREEDEALLPDPPRPATGRSRWSSPTTRSCSGGLLGHPRGRARHHRGRRGRRRTGRRRHGPAPATGRRPHGHPDAELDGLDAAERILAEPGVETAVVMLTTFDASEYVYRALRIGASGFLLKDAPSDRLLDAVGSPAAGEALIAPSITRRLVERFSVAAPDPVDGAELGTLTPRELDVLRLIARGLSNQEIARELVLGENTIKTHVTRVLFKLGLRDRVQAVVLAYETGVVQPGPSRSTERSPSRGG
jgi:DNA-binding NarL/FixJ family response regulator